MTAGMSKKAILDNLALVASWLAVRRPKRHYELVVAGGAALALHGHKDKTIDVDVLFPRELPPEVTEAGRLVASAQGLGPDWLNVGVAKVTALLEEHGGLPGYFAEFSAPIEVAANLTLRVVSRQTLIDLKLLAASPSERKHIDDLKALAPTKSELAKARKLVLGFDSSPPRKEDLEVVLRELRKSHGPANKRKPRR
jgi:hypothetical protein